MVEDMYLEETKDQDVGSDEGKSDGSKSNNTADVNGVDPPKPNCDAISKAAACMGGAENGSKDIVIHASLLKLTGDHQA